MDAKRTNDDPGVAEAVYGHDPLCVALPMPPSVNHLFPTVNGRRVASSEYKRWQRAAALGAHWPVYSEDQKNRIAWAVVIEARGMGHQRDLDNIAKPVLDLIAAMTGLRDRYCNTIELTRTGLLTTETEPYVYVRVGVAA